MAAYEGAAPPFARALFFLLRSLGQVADGCSQAQVRSKRDGSSIKHVRAGRDRSAAARRIHETAADEEGAHSL